MRDYQETGRVAIPSVRVSVFRPREVVRLGWEAFTYDLPSQSPRFGSRCFVQEGGTTMVMVPLNGSRNPLGSGLGVSSRRFALGFVRRSNRRFESQSPRFGSRCFVSFWRAEMDELVKDQVSRNPLGSGLGVSSLWLPVL